MSKLNEQQVDSIINLMREAGEFLRKLASVADMAGDSLEETKRVHQAVKQHRVPGDFTHFLQYVEQQNAEIAPLLKDVDVAKFDMGRLWIRVPNPVIQFMLDGQRDTIARYLGELYGGKFKVRVNGPERRAPDL